MFLAAYSLTIGCTQKSGETQASNQPPAIRSIVLGPTPFHRETDLTAQVDTHDPDNDTVQVRYFWYVNDRLIESVKTPALPASLLKRGDRVHLEAVPFDGKVTGGSLKSDAITVGNSLPSVAQVGIGLKSDGQGDRLQALVDASDHDQDALRYVYRWMKNGQVIKEGEEDFLDLREIHSRDQVVVEVKPRDDHAAGKPVRSAPYVVGNVAPRIVSTPPQLTAGNRYEYTVKSVDPDSDSVSFQLAEAPPGMAIDRVVGNIVWNRDDMKPGVHRVKVVVTDEKGGSGFQEFELAIADSGPAVPES